MYIKDLHNSESNLIHGLPVIHMKVIHIVKISYNFSKLVNYYMGISTTYQQNITNDR